MILDFPRAMENDALTCQDRIDMVSIASCLSKRHDNTCEHGERAKGESRLGCCSLQDLMPLRDLPFHVITRQNVQFHRFLSHSCA